MDGVIGTRDDNLRIWPSSACVDRGNNASVPADTTDLDIDGEVDVNDLMLFAEYWLQRTEYNERTCDFNRDTRVSFADFAQLGLYWQVADCKNPDWCEETDLNLDGGVDANDLMFFCDRWLERTEWSQPPQIP